MAGLFAVLGHVFPIFYGFKGGKGVLVTATMALILTPIPFVFLILVFCAIVAMSKYVSLGSVCVATLYPITVNFYVKLVFGGQKLPGIMALCTILLAIFIVWCHRHNLERISNRTERKISIGGKKKNKDE
jgi:glycerol-3-phosphate acyltransferase PlsY